MVTQMDQDVSRLIFFRKFYHFLITYRTFAHAFPVTRHKEKFLAHITRLHLLRDSTGSSHTSGTLVSSVIIRSKQKAAVSRNVHGSVITS